MKKVHLPLSVGWNDRGHGHGDYAVLNKMGEPITIPFDYQEDAEFICKAVNNFEELKEVVEGIYMFLKKHEKEAKIIDDKVFARVKNLLKELEA